MNWKPGQTPGWTWNWAWSRPDDAEMQRAAGRIYRWTIRHEHRQRGGATLTTAGLERLIYQTELAAMVEGNEMVIATHLLRLADMQLELRWRQFLGETVTDWPDVPSWR